MNNSKAIQVDKKVVNSVFDSVATRHPDRIAIEGVEGSISFSTLRNLSDAFSQHLIQNGVRKGDRVAVYLPPGIPYVVAILAIGKVGGIFMPMEPGKIPPLRLKYMLFDAEPCLVITEPQSITEMEALCADRSYFPASPKLLAVSFKDNTLEINFPEAICFATQGTRHDELHPVDMAGEDPYYLIYTSGSTGTPKAILGNHMGLSHFIHWEMNELALDFTVKTLAVAPLTFDVSFRDIFIPLLSGGTLVIPPVDIKQHPERFLVLAGEKRITLLHLVPSFFRLLTQMIQDKPSFASSLSDLKFVLLAGEPLYGKDARLWESTAGQRSLLINLYGPSETSLAKTFNRITGPYSDGAIVPLGIPIRNTAVLILKGSSLCEIGEVGEICIKTPFRSLGYLNDPELNHSKFIQNPLHDEFVDIIYCTGDMGRYANDRSIVFVGRKDHQVKIRGNRVELTEIEKCGRELLEMSEVVISAVKDHHGEFALCCYYRSDLSREDSNDLLMSHFALRLPDYMLPSYYIKMEEFPLNLNGKIDRRSLPVPEESWQQAKNFQPPSNDLEEAVAALWSEIIGVKKIDINTSFFQIGGHSLAATILLSRVFRKFRIEISLKEFFDNSTIRSLANLIAGKEKSDLKPIPGVLKKDHYEVSAAQKRLYIAHVQNGRAYNMQDSYLFKGNFDKTALGNAFGDLIQRHEILRTTFTLIQGEPRQVVHAFERWPFKVGFQDLRRESDRFESARKHAVESVEKIFDLGTGPLMEALVTQLEDDLWSINLIMHHIISDGWSKDIMLRELTVLYNTRVSALASPLLPLRIQYKDFTVWHNSQLKDESVGSHKAFWLNTLRDIRQRTSLPQDFQRPGQNSFSWAHHAFELEKGLSEKLLSFATMENTTLFVLILSLVDVLIYRYTQSSPVVVGTPISGREHPDLTDQIGLYVNTLVVANEINAEETYNSHFANVKKRLIDCYSHQAYPYDAIVEDLQEAGKATEPFNVMVQLLNSIHQEKESMNDVQIDRFLTGKRSSLVDMYINFLQTDDRISVDIEYNPELFSADTISFMGFNFSALADSCVSSPEKTLKEIIHRDVSGLPMVHARGAVDVQF